MPGYLERCLSVLCGVGFSLVLTACTSLTLQKAPVPDEALLVKVLSGELLLGRHWQPEELPEEKLFALTPDMMRFAERAVGNEKRRFHRAQLLHEALFLPTHQGGRGLVYSAYHTNTPQEAFLSREVNCVSFTLMYVAMARYVGLDARVNEVDVPPNWDLRNQDAFLFLRHINAKVRLAPNDTAVLDLELNRYSPAYTQRLIPEDLAAAQFYNNRGMELSDQGDVAGGFLHLRKALLLDERQSYIWSNMATLYRRQGMFKEAEVAYLKGLQLDAGDLTIISNLSGLYRRMGRVEEAEHYYHRAERHRARNPYYLYSLARRELEKGNPQSALKLLQKPLRQRKDEPRFYELAEAIYRALGDEVNARRMAESAEGLRIKYLLQTGR